jgi:lysophospholipid acyltransferase (LPLAT)-like uncharacterized protein
MDRLSLKDRIQIALFPPLAWALTGLISRTLRLKRIGNPPQDTPGSPGRITVLWHGRHFISYHLVASRQTRILVSPSRDGQLVSRLLALSGYGIIYGSTHKSPVRALLSCIEHARSGSHLLFAVDGPKGPPCKVQAGALFVAEKTGARIVPVSFAARRKWTFRSWDSFIIPHPFTRACIAYGEPFTVPNPSPREQMDGLCLRLEEILNSLTLMAEQAIR